MKRIFVAIPMSKELQEQVLEWQNEHKKFPVRWISGKNLHVTLLPPWYAEDSSLAAKLLKEGESVQSIISKLKELQKRLEPFEIHFDRITFGPNAHQPRMIWAEGQANRELLGLKDRIYKTLDKEPENRPFKLHLTMARFRPEDLSEFQQKELDDKVRWRQRVDSFVLMESRLSSKGADYEVLEKFILGMQE